MVFSILLIHIIVLFWVILLGIGTRDAKLDWKFDHSLRIDSTSYWNRDNKTS